MAFVWIVSFKHGGVSLPVCDGCIVSPCCESSERAEGKKPGNLKFPKANGEWWVCIPAAIMFDKAAWLKSWRWKGWNVVEGGVGNFPNILDSSGSCLMKVLGVVGFILHSSSEPQTSNEEFGRWLLAWRFQNTQISGKWAIKCLNDLGKGF